MDILLDTHEKIRGSLEFASEFRRDLMRDRSSAFQVRTGRWSVRKQASVPFSSGGDDDDDDDLSKKNQINFQLLPVVTWTDSPNRGHVASTLEVYVVDT